MLTYQIRLYLLLLFKWFTESINLTVVEARLTLDYGDTQRKISSINSKTEEFQWQHYEQEQV